MNPSKFRPRGKVSNKNEDLGHEAMKAHTSSVTSNLIRISNIIFSLSEAGHVSLEIYNVLGRRVALLQRGYTEAGEHHFTWNAGDQPSGLYFYRLQVGTQSQMRRMILLK